MGVIESVDVEYVSKIKLPCKLRKSMRGLIDIKSNDNKCFLWCYIRHLNLLK